MTRDDIIRMAREAHGPITSQWWDMDAAALERFAALVAAHALANIDPSKLMSYQEGYEAGRTAEREACALEVWPAEIKVWSEEEMQAMTQAFNRAQEKHGWYETIMAVGASVLKMKSSAIRARGGKT